MNLPKFENYINNLDMRGILPSCDTVHPLVNDALEELESADDFETMWEDRLTDVQKQLRHCLANELKASLLPNFPPDVAHKIDSYLRPLLQYAISASWLVYQEVGKEFGENE